MDWKRCIIYKSGVNVWGERGGGGGGREKWEGRGKKGGKRGGKERKRRVCRRGKEKSRVGGGRKEGDREVKSKEGE